MAFPKSLVVSLVPETPGRISVQNFMIYLDFQVDCAKTYVDLLSKPRTAIPIRTGPTTVYVFAMGLTDRTGTLTISYSQVEQMLWEAKQHSPMDYQMPLSEISSVVVSLVSGDEIARWLKRNNTITHSGLASHRNLSEQYRQARNASVKSVTQSLSFGSTQMGSVNVSLALRQVHE